MEPPRREVHSLYRGQAHEQVHHGMPLVRAYAEREPMRRGVVADFVRYELEDGSEVFFETAEASFVSMRGGSADVVNAGKLGDPLRHIAAAADEVSKGLREQLAPEEIHLEFGVKLSGEVNWWFFAKSSGEASINVKLTWRKDTLEHLGSAD
jgi:hypothetical protein